MINVDRFITYNDLQTFVNEDVVINSSNGSVVNAGSEEQIKERREKLKALNVVLGIESTIHEEHDYRLGLCVVIENCKVGLLAKPVVGVIYKDEDSGLYRKVVSIDRIPTRFLSFISTVRNNFEAWKQGTIKSYKDTWPLGFVEIE